MNVTITVNAVCEDVPTVDVKSTSVMTDAPLTAALILVITGYCSGQNVPPPGSLIRAVGENVTFTPKISSTDFYIIIWNFIDGSESNRIINSAPGGSTPAPGYEGRVSVNRSTASLELRELTLRDTGVYGVALISSAGVQQTDTSTLNVYERISDASIIGPTETLIAGNSSANLSCQATGSTIVSREWLKNGHPLSTSNRITFSGDNSSVFIDPVEGADNGEYQCILTNPVSRGVANYSLIVNYGPENVVIHGNSKAQVNSRVELMCSATSVPPATFSWSVKRTKIARKDIFIIESTTLADTGTYTCVAVNDVTRLRTTAVHDLTVTGEIVIADGPSLSGGAIAGIAIGTVVGVGAIGGGTFFAFKKWCL